MSVIKEEFKRMIKYAEGLGVKVHIKPRKRNDDAAYWTLDGTEITILRRKRDSITTLMLSLIHELGHHVSWIMNGRKYNKRLDKALDSGENLKKGQILAKKHRKVIYEDEKFDSQYHEVIYNELNLKFPKYKVMAEMELSNWGYYIYYQTGKDPTKKEFSIKQRELRKKWKKRLGGK